MKYSCRILYVVLIASIASAQPFAIGHQSVNWQDPDRGNRNVTAVIYYPADVAGNNVPVTEGEFPVVSFGHGFLLSASLYDYLWETLVPEGFILVLSTTEGGLLPSHNNFGLDLAFLIQKLESDNLVPASPFYSKISGKSCVLGHSMGGGASFLAAESDSTIDAIANLAAAETSPSAINAAQSLIIPALLFSGSVDCVTPPENHQIPMYDALASECKYLLTISGASHCQFAENSFTCNLGEIACDNPTISRFAQQQTVTDFLLPWLIFTLKDESDAFCEFRDMVASDPRITFVSDCSVVPDAPILTITPISNGVRIRWSAVSYACSYSVELSTTGLQDDDFSVIWSGIDTAVVDTDNLPYAVYRVKASSE